MTQRLKTLKQINNYLTKKLRKILTLQKYTFLNYIFIPQNQRKSINIIIYNDNTKIIFFIKTMRNEINF